MQQVQKLFLNRLLVQKVGLTYLVGVVVSCVVEVVADGRGEHDQQVSAVHLTPQVSEPDQTVHLLRGEEAEHAVYSCDEAARLNVL